MINMTYHQHAPVSLIDDRALLDHLVVLVHPRELRGRLRLRLARQIGDAGDEPVELALLLRGPLRLI